MNLKHRVNKLEAALGGRSTKHYLWVRALYGEAKEAAIERYLRAHGITLDAVGCLWLWGDDCCESIDFKHYARQEDLIGYCEAIKARRAWWDAPTDKRQARRS